MMAYDSIPMEAGMDSTTNTNTGTGTAGAHPVIPHDGDVNDVTIDDAFMDRVLDIVRAIQSDDIMSTYAASVEHPDEYRVASIADGLMVSWYEDEGDRPTLAEAVKTAVYLATAG